MGTQHVLHQDDERHVRRAYRRAGVSARVADARPAHRIRGGRVARGLSEPGLLCGHRTVRALIHAALCWRARGAPVESLAPRWHAVATALRGRRPAERRDHDPRDHPRLPAAVTAVLALLPALE